MLDVLAASWPILAGMVFLLLASGFFSASETAVFSIGAADLRGIEESGRRGSAALRRLVGDRARVLVTILLGNLTINILYFNLGALMSYRFAAADAEVAAAITTVLTLAGVVIFGEIIPKVMAVHHPARVALLASLPLVWMELLLHFPRILLSGIATALGRVIMWRHPKEGALSSAELEALLHLSADDGHLRDREGAWLRAILDLSSVAVREIMVPRVSIVAHSLDAGREELLRILTGHPRKRIPVYRESLDHIEGYLDVREVFLKPELGLDELVRPVAFVPESAVLAQVVDRVVGGEAQLFIVVDEYGGTEGLLTKEDVVEAVVGDLSDEGEPAVDPVQVIAPGHYEVDAGLGIRSWGRIMGASMDELPVSTIGGLVSFLLGKVPQPGDSAVRGPLRFRVLSVRGRRPQRIEIRLAGTGEPPP
jgi:putative hemolysin